MTLIVIDIMIALRKILSSVLIDLIACGRQSISMNAIFLLCFRKKLCNVKITLKCLVEGDISQPGNVSLFVKRFTVQSMYVFNLVINNSLQEVNYNVIWTYCQKLYSNCKSYLMNWYLLFVLGRYFRLQCKFSTCIPCDYRYPKCEDKDDGIFMATGKDIDFTNRYMICKDKRRISTGSCPWEPLWRVPTYLYKGKCSHPYEIPTDFNENGRLPSCKGKLNGNYLFRDRPCDAYYRCIDGIASPFLCPYGTVFDVEMNNCLRRWNCTLS